MRLTQQAVEALRSHRSAPARGEAKDGGLYQDQGLVFAGEGGTSSTPPTSVSDPSHRS